MYKPRTRKKCCQHLEILFLLDNTVSLDNIQHAGVNVKEMINHMTAVRSHHLKFKQGNFPQSYSNS